MEEATEGARAHRGMMAPRRVATAIGLVAFASGMFLEFGERLRAVAGVLLLAGIVLTIVGCWVLVLRRARRVRDGGGAGFDVALGILCLTLGLLFFEMAVQNSDMGVIGRVVAGSVAALLVLGGVSVVVLSLRSCRLTQPVTASGVEEGTAYVGARRVLRMAGRIITGLGLAAFWGVFLAAVIGGWDAVPVAPYWIGFGMAASGCVGLATIVGLLFPPLGRVGTDASLGLLCVPAGLLLLPTVFGDGAFGVWLAYRLAIVLMLVLGGAALAVVSIRGFRPKGADDARTQV